ncbi:hypothetical protein DVV91_16990 [Clostridium botulinum]|uniref:hypothetical protein n=1 Tax=Clostridium botulinum TaxID=1491 RepID=UPI001966ED8C|nr:hypothetical protein [Clostridium botulinum]MBN1076019.1 hypothetical protein [Clostridium botulinum]
MCKFNGTKLNKNQYVLLTGCKVKGDNSLYKVTRDIANDEHYMGDNGYLLEKVKLNGEIKTTGYTLYFYDNNGIEYDPQVTAKPLNDVSELKEANKELKAYLLERDNKTLVNKITETDNKIDLNSVGTEYKVKMINKVEFSTNGYNNNKAFKKGQYFKIKVVEGQRIRTELLNKTGESYCSDTAMKYTHGLNKNLSEEFINNSVVILVNKVAKESLKECNKEEEFKKSLNTQEQEKEVFTVNKTIENIKPMEKITVDTATKENKTDTQCKVVFNEDKNGIELYFTDKPSEEVRNNIKAKGFMWNSLKLCWFIKDTETTREYLQELGLLNKDNKQENTEIKTEELKEIEEPKIIIDETLAKRCKENMSFSDYKEGSATQEYNRRVEEMAEKINSAKENVSEDESKIKLDYLLQKFKKDYANWVNKHNSNGSNHVSVMISGRGNYNMSKHNKYVAREGKLWDELENIMDIESKIDKIINSENIIKSSDKNAIDKLRKKLEQEEKQHQEIKEYNKMARKEGKEPYATYVLQNSNQRIKNIKDRIKHLEKLSQQETKETEINGIKIIDNVEANRLQIIFNDKPNEDIRKKLKSNGFRWSPSNNAWQRYRGSEAERKAKIIIESMGLLNKAI